MKQIIFIVIFIFIFSHLGFCKYDPLKKEPAQKPASANSGQKDIVILSYGDSIGHGYNLRYPEEENYPVQLDKRLNAGENKFQYDVKICGGYCPTKYYFHLKDEIIRLRPKMVIVEIELCNDISDEALLRWRGREENGAPSSVTGGRYIALSDGRTIATVAFGDDWFERTRVYTKGIAIFGNTMNRILPNPLFADKSHYYFYNLGFDRFFLSGKQIERGFERMFASLKAIYELCHKHGAEFLLVILPSQYVFYDNQYTQGSSELIRRAEHKAQKLAIPYISLKEDMNKYKGDVLFFDFCHPTARGHQIIADAIYRECKARGY